MRGTAGYVYGSGRDVDKEQYVLRDETPHPTDFWPPDIPSEPSETSTIGGVRLARERARSRYL